VYPTKGYSPVRLAQVTLAHFFPFHFGSTHRTLNPKISRTSRSAEHYQHYTTTTVRLHTTALEKPLLMASIENPTIAAASTHQSAVMKSLHAFMRTLTLAQSVELRHSASMRSEQRDMMARLFKAIAEGIKHL
jgi:hypothetical protein